METQTKKIQEMFNKELGDLKNKQREIKVTIPSTYLKRYINLPKKEKDLCSENYKTLVKEIKDDKNR